MYIDIRHLRSIKAIHQAGGLARAADVLNITQSALSHQMRALEDRAGIDLFVHRTKPLKLSVAGLKMLRLAERILPEVEGLEEDFNRILNGKSGRLHIAIECHACFEWLFPVLDLFRRAWPDVDVDIRPGLAFDALPALVREEVDLVITSDPDASAGIEYAPLFDYEPVFIAAENHPLAAKPYIEAEDIAGETLISYPMDKSRLDVFTQLLTPANLEPKALREVELTSVIMLLVASNRGVSVLPDWVVRDARYKKGCITRPLTKGGLTQRLYAATRKDEATLPYLAHFIRLGRSEPPKLQRHQHGS